LRSINGSSDEAFLNGREGINSDIKRLIETKDKVNNSKHKTVFYSVNFDKKSSIKNLQNKIDSFEDINFYYVPVVGEETHLLNS
jgi:hypothetical protein